MQRKKHVSMTCLRFQLTYIIRLKRTACKVQSSGRSESQLWKNGVLIYIY